MINRTLGFNSIKSIYVQISWTRKWGNLNSNSGIFKKKKKSTNFAYAEINSIGRKSRRGKDGQKNLTDRRSESLDFAYFQVINRE